jgi:hypothetical protein
MAFELPPRIVGPAPTLTTVHEIEVIIRRATHDGETPISLAEIKRRMKAKAVRHSTVKAAVDHLQRMGCVWRTADGSAEWGTPASAFAGEKLVRLR